MSTKSYTLADGSTVTVTANENGVPFNEGMQALTKAIKARVAVRDGSGTGGASGKLVPTLELLGTQVLKGLMRNGIQTYSCHATGADFSNTFDITYNGDGILQTFSKIDSTSNYTFSVNSDNKLVIKVPSYSIVEGLIFASEGQNYASQIIILDCDTGD